MKKIRLIIALLCVMLFAGHAMASGLSLIPQPKEMTAGEGAFTLSRGMTVGGSGLSQEMTAEVNNFVTALNATTGLNATTVNGNGMIAVAVDPSLPAEGYTLAVTTSGVSIKASQPAGLFYAFQTIKKMLPDNVMAGVSDASARYELPVVTIADEPRFSYRGFMLDVSRHFFDTDQVKKMLDLMAIYKLNRFHWHLTDDQGWRLPVAKYPKLTVEGATNRNILQSNFADGVKANQTQTRPGKNVAYGPYAYTAEQIKEIVAYAKARHIEVIPEIDMPGHMVAAIHAYPEFSTDPESKRAIAAGVALDSEPVAGNIESHFTHNIWNIGGVSKDVLDISNPKVMTFVKDVVDVLAELFPYEYIHIGGDECPTNAWEHSANCQALKSELGLKSDAALQSWFTKQIADYAKEKHGRKIMGWNEIITSGGADVNMITSLDDPTIFCWIGGEGKAEQLGLKHVYTPFNGGYYINRSYRGFDKIGAVGDGALTTSYSVNPPDHKNCIGVQGTFWTEQVDRNTDLEYLALPRLIALSEQGWTPAGQKDYDNFMGRLAADTTMLNMAGYNYARHQIVDLSNIRKPDPNKWYRLKATSTDERAGRVWELLGPNSPIIADKSDKGAAANRLWTNTVDNNSDWQLFRFVEDPANAGKYAIICKALPNGSLNSTPTSTELTGRWEYQPNKVTYGFVLDRNYYDANSDDLKYAIRPSNLEGKYLNCSKNGQGLAVNVYNNPADGNGGILIFDEAGTVEGGDTPTTPETPEVPEVGDVPAPGVYYRLFTRFNGDASQSRHGSVIELLRDDAGKGNNAQADRLWSNAPAEEGDDNYDYQWFTFESDPEGSGYYAMVCKAKPDGSVNSTPAVANNSNTARWDYDNANKHYGFYLVDTAKGKSTQGVDDAGFYSALTSKDAADGWYMNTSAAGQGFSVHLYSDPTDQNAGIYTFVPDPSTTGIDSVVSDAPAAEGIYDLQGRRLQRITTPGLYIIDGKKTFVK